jgi:hypothetical protein
VSERTHRRPPSVEMNNEDFSSDVKTISLPRPFEVKETGPKNELKTFDLTEETVVHDLASLRETSRC